MFRCDGEYWTIVWRGKRCLVKDVLGLRYIVQLLRHPGREFHALDLVGGCCSTRVRGGDGVAALDEEAKAAYRRRLRDLRDDLDEAERICDLGRAARAREEEEVLTEQLAAAVGLGGRDRRAGFRSGTCPLHGHPGHPARAETDPRRRCRRSPTSCGCASRPGSTACTSRTRFTRRTGWCDRDRSYKPVVCLPRAGFKLYQITGRDFENKRAAAFVTNEDIQVEERAPSSPAGHLSGGTMKGRASVALVCSLVLSVWASPTRASSLSSVLGQGRFADAASGAAGAGAREHRGADLSGRLRELERDLRLQSRRSMCSNGVLESAVRSSASAPRPSAVACSTSA